MEEEVVVVSPGEDTRGATFSIKVEYNNFSLRMSIQLNIAGAIAQKLRSPAADGDENPLS